MKKITLLVVVFLFALYSKAQPPIQEFNFNGTLNNLKNDVLFSGNVKFAIDRFGKVNSAINVDNSSIEATILNLPLGNSSRTISVWVKYNDLANTNYIWGYGSFYSARYFGLFQQKAKDSTSDLNLVGYGMDNDVAVATTVLPNTWYHYVVTYDGLTSKIYRNGVLIKSSVSTRKLTSGIVFSIGKMGTLVSIDADIDDLKIYDIALVENEVKALYVKESNMVASKMSTASSDDRSADMEIDAKAVKTVAGTKQNAVSANKEELRVDKSSEIFSTKGLKVFSGGTNGIDISALPEGTYLLKITNSSTKN